MHDVLKEANVDFSKTAPLGKEMVRVTGPAMNAAKTVAPILDRIHE